MATKKTGDIEIGGRLFNTATGNIVAGADAIKDEGKNMLQSEINDYIVGVEEAVSNLSPEQTSAMGVAAKANNNEAKLGYYVCSSAESATTKQIASTNYTLSVGGSIKIKMEHKNTAASDVKLKVGSADAKALYYDGELVSATNTWDDGETVDVYYDGTSYYANNTSGGGKFKTGEKVKEVGIDAVPIEGSRNLVDSGGVANKFSVILGEEEQNIDLSTYDANNGIASSDDLIFRSNGGYGSHRYKVVPIIAGRTIKVTPVSNTVSAVVIPMKDNVFVNGTAVNACDGITSVERLFYPTDIEIPSDAKYLYVYTRNSSEVSHEPAIKYLAVEGLIEKLQDEKLDANQGANNEGKLLGINVLGDVVAVYNYGPENKARLDELEGSPEVDYNLDEYDTGVGIIQAVDGVLVLKDNATYGYYRYKVLPVEPNRKLYVVPKSSSKGFQYCFLKDNNLTSGQPVNTCSGYDEKFAISVATEIVLPSDCNYVWFRLSNVNTGDDYTPQLVKLKGIEGALDSKIDKQQAVADVGKYLKVGNDGLVSPSELDSDEDKIDVYQGVANAGKYLKVGQDGDVFPSEISGSDDKVDIYQGVGNAGKILQVGQDGNVTLGTGSEGEDISTCVRRMVSRTFYLGENLISGIVGSGEGWVHNNGQYTHSGDTSPLIFDYATTEGDVYIAILRYSVTGTNEMDVCVSIGDGALCDIYNGTLGPFYVGMISDGGKLKITVTSAYSGYIYDVELRKVVNEEDADLTVTLDTSSNKHYENVDGGSMADNVTGWWNVSISANDSLKKNQNGSRNVAIGQRALSALESGTRNIGIGTFALHRLVSGNRNIAIGADSAWYITAGEDNVAVGKGAMGEVKGESADNVAIGSGALSITTDEGATENVAVGRRALSGGSSSIAKNGCTAVGYSAGLRNNTNCVAVGKNSAFYMQGSGNVAIGAEAMNNYNVDGSNNICIGKDAKLYPSTRPATVDNSIAIGYNVKATKSNQMLLGNDNTTEVIIAGKKIVFNQDGTVTWEAVS